MSSDANTPESGPETDNPEYFGASSTGDDAVVAEQEAATAPDESTPEVIPADQADEVLAAQLTAGLSGADLSRAVVAYEPVWSIGPGKTPADAPYIQRVAGLLKDTVPGIDVVYGGGLKADNARMLASIPEIDGGLIALTRFSGEIGFYPDEYREIVDLYLG